MLVRCSVCNEVESERVGGLELAALLSVWRLVALAGGLLWPAPASQGHAEVGVILPADGAHGNHPARPELLDRRDIPRQLCERAVCRSASRHCTNV